MPVYTKVECNLDNDTLLIIVIRKQKALFMIEH